VLDSIARLEYELGLTDVPPPRRGGMPSALDAMRGWQAAAGMKAANYSQGFSGKPPARFNEEDVRAGDYRTKHERRVDDFAHCGSYYGYTAGCRCQDCRAANTAYKRERRALLRELEP